MAHRCRTCGEAHFAEVSAIRYPLPEELARFAPLIPDLLEAAREFESLGPDGTPIEFVRWLDVDVERADGLLPRARPMAGHPGVTRR